MSASRFLSPFRILLFAIVLVSSTHSARITRPKIQSTIHTVNNVRLHIDNAGSMGGGDLLHEGRVDAFTGGRLVLGSEFPASSYLTCCAMGLVVGAIVGKDTLVSSSFDLAGASSLTAEQAEFSPDVSPYGDLKRRSTLDPESAEYEDAVSQEDIIAVYTDTFRTENGAWVGREPYSQRRHIPLPIEVIQRSYAWSFEYAENLILFDFSVKNMGTETLQDAFVGIAVLSAIGDPIAEAPGSDDLAGFLHRAVLPFGCQLLDTIKMVWMSDADGDPVGGRFQNTRRPYRSDPHAMGLRFLGSPPTVDGNSPRLSFNWRHLWSRGGWGPRRREDFRDFGVGALGWPYGDPNQYYQLSSGEIDYDVMFTASIRPWDLNWLYPPQEDAADISDGFRVSFEYATGPFSIPPGGVLSVPLAFVCGENLHTDPNNAARYLPHDPETYKNNLDFSDLVKNATWAEWIYDNPGYDTDGDGDSGVFKVCIHDSVYQNGQWHASVAETVWVRGDGVPDWRAAGPPPAPEFWVTPIENGIHVRFNGHRSETEVDIFSRIIDFEGYRVYLGRDTHWDNLALVASYDREDFDQWIFRRDLDTLGSWQLQNVPFTVDSLRCLYGRTPDPCDDMDFDPRSTAVHNPYQHPDYPDSMYFFTRHEHNASDLGISTPITRIYPDAPDPSAFHPDSIPDEYYTEDGYLKYYEYEYTIENLLPTVPYWVNVTAFDFGAPIVYLDALETSRTLGAKKIYPLSHSSSPTATGNLKVYVYPNPWRIDGGYRDHGFEGRMREDRADNRVREVHFANLPAKCKISIFSLDGDLIRSLDHDMPESDPNHTHDSWDMITRNTQEPVSGLYYWVVEASDGRTQIGKLVLIM